jgi:hypothetical protein
MRLWKKLTTSVLMLAGALALSGSLSASEPGVLHVEDNGKVFTSEGIAKAEAAMSETTFLSKTHFNVVTYGKIPEAKRDAYEKAKGTPTEKSKFFHDWAEQSAKAHKSRGVFVLISMEGAHIRAIDDRTTDVKRDFDSKDLKAVQEKFTEGFKLAFKETDAAKKKPLHDAALLEATNYVIDQLKNTTGNTTTNRNTTTGAANVKEKEGSNIMSYVCIGIVALLGVWLVIGIVRALTGGGGGGQYAGGGGYGGGYGGGGGFMSGIMGGLLGAVAGNYLYNNFFGGHSSASASDGYGSTGSTGNDTSGDGDYSGGADGGGSDFGGDTGGDFGGDTGGGDFGGGDFGGDSGGGGDFGGGDW